MDWEIIKQKMMERGYKLNTTGRRPGASIAWTSNPIVKQIYIKEIDSTRLECHVTTEADQCDRCWKARIVWYGLKMFMAIDSQQFTFINDQLFESVEAQILEYVTVCKSIH